MRISVAMCTYNGANYIEEQLNSICSQSRMPDEIVICDDGSTDTTVQQVTHLLEKWQGKSTVVINETNLGYIRNFEKVIGLCSGDIIFLSDQDDVWRCDKVKVIVECFEQHPEVVMVFHDAVIVDANLKRLSPSYWDMLHFREEDSLPRILTGWNVVQGASMAFRKKLYEEAYPFPEDVYHDHWLGIVAALIGTVMPLPYPLLLYRQHQDNQMGASEKEQHLSSKEAITGFHRKMADQARKNFQELAHLIRIYRCCRRQIERPGLLGGRVLSEGLELLESRRQAIRIRSPWHLVRLYVRTFFSPIRWFYTLRHLRRDLRMVWQYDEDFEHMSER